MKPASIVASLTLGLSACAGAGQGVSVSPLAPMHPPPLPPDCSIQFVYEWPTRPYVALAELSSHVTDVPPQGAQEKLRAEACKLGADAVIVTKSQVLNYYGHVLVEGVAITFKGASMPESTKPQWQAVPPPAGAPKAEPQPAPQATPAPQAPATAQ